MAELAADYQKRKAAEQKPAAPVGPTPGFRAEAERNVNVQANDAELGSPTSYGGGFRAPQRELPAAALSTGGPLQPGGQDRSDIGGQGKMAGTPEVPGQTLVTGSGGFDPSKPSFSNPVHVIRGMAQTWAGPGSGEEHRTLAQANQAFNREEGVGGFRYPGQEKDEIAAKAHVEGSAAAAKNPYYDALAAKVKEETEGVKATNRKTDLAANQATLRKQLEEEVGVPSADGKNLSLPVDPGFQGIHKKMDRLTMQGVSPEEAYKAVAPDLHKLYYTPENLYGAINLMEKQTGQPVPPELKKQLMSGTPEAMQALYPYTRQAAQQPRGVVARTFNPAPAVGPAATQPTPPGGVVAPVQGGPNNAWAKSFKSDLTPTGPADETSPIPQF